MKFLLVIKICSALHGDCLPEQNVNIHDSWFNCAKSGVYETLELMEIIKPIKTISKDEYVDIKRNN